MHCLITAGPTREFIDPVRFLSNPSTGKMGYALTEAALKRGWSVSLVSGPVQLTPPSGADVTDVITGNEMFHACAELFPKVDVFIMCAAVMDMRPVKTFANKQKKDKLDWTLDFEPVVDILKTLSAQKEHQTLVGFAAETQKIEQYAKRKLIEKNLDWIVANNVSDKSIGFESDQNAVQVFGKEGSQTNYGPKAKTLIAEDILKHISS